MFSSEKKMAERFASVSEDELCKKCVIKQLMNSVFAWYNELSNEDMILALAGQFKQLSHEPEKVSWLNGIRTHDLCDAGAVL